MFTRGAGRKNELWKDFLYSDPEGFIVQTVKFANGTTGRGLFVKSNLKRKSFSWVIGDRWEQLKSPTLTTWWKFRMEKTQCSLTLPMGRTLAWRGLSTTSTNQLPPTVEWKRSMTTRADHIASSWKLVLFFQVSLIFQIVEQSSVMFFKILKEVKPRFSWYQKNSQIDNQKCFEKSVTVFECKRIKVSTLNVHFWN